MRGDGRSRLLRGRGGGGEGRGGVVSPGVRSRDRVRIDLANGVSRIRIRGGIGGGGGEFSSPRSTPPPPSVSPLAAASRSALTRRMISSTSALIFARIGASFSLILACASRKVRLNCSLKRGLSSAPVETNSSSTSLRRFCSSASTRAMSSGLAGSSSGRSSSRSRSVPTRSRICATSSEMRSRSGAARSWIRSCASVNALTNSGVKRGFELAARSDGSSTSSEPSEGAAARGAGTATPRRAPPRDVQRPDARRAEATREEDATSADAIARADMVRGARASEDGGDARGRRVEERLFGASPPRKPRGVRRGVATSGGDDRRDAPGAEVEGRRNKISSDEARRNAEMSADPSFRRLPSPHLFFFPRAAPRKKIRANRIRRKARPGRGVRRCRRAALSRRPLRAAPTPRPPPRARR